MKIADFDFQRLIGQAGSGQSDECEETKQKPKQIKPPMPRSDVLHDPIAPQHRGPAISSCLRIQATLFIVRRKEGESRPMVRNATIVYSA